MNHQLVKCLSAAATAVRLAPEDTDTAELRGFLSKRGISGDELDAMVARQCTDAGAVIAALQRSESKPKPAKKKAAKKKAAKK